MSFVGIDPSDIRLYTDTSGTLHIESISDPSNTIAVYAGTTGVGSYESTIGSYVQQITFDDEAHTTWDLTGGLTLTGADGGNDGLYGTAYDDTISGMGGNDTLYGNGGDDTLIGGAGDDYLYGGTGSDTYVFASGWGSDTISEASNSDTNTVSFVGIDPSDIRLYTDTGGSLHIESISDPSNTIAVYAGTTGTGSYESTIGSYVQQITFDDEAHTTWDLTGGLNLTGSDTGGSLFGTAYNDTITAGSGASYSYLYGNGGDDTLISSAGNDTMDGGTGNDTASYANAASAVTVNLSTGTATGDGSDTLSNIENVIGSANGDTITGDSNDNILAGGDGLDTLTGGAGADTFMFDATAFNNIDVITDFSTGDGDKIDIKALIPTFDPMTSTLSQFVYAMNDGSGNSLLEVDRDGPGTTYGFQTVAQINGVTGLNAATLVTNGNLIVHA